MADDIKTVLKFVGDARQAEATIQSLIASLQRAADQSKRLYADLAKPIKQPKLPTVAPLTKEVESANSAIEKLSESLRRATTDARTLFAETAKQPRTPQAPVVKPVEAPVIKPPKIPSTAPVFETDEKAALSYAQALARLQVAQGDLAGAQKTLVNALAAVPKETTAAVRAQTQLVGVEAQLTGAAGKAETAILREAQALARLQQISGNTPAAIKTLSDALDKVGNKSSLPALRAELQKTYLDTNYANSPLIGAINQINQGLSLFRPLLGGVGSNLQTLVNIAGAAGTALSNTGASFQTAGKSAGVFTETLRNVGSAIQSFFKDQGGEASATDFFLGLIKAGEGAAERIRGAFGRIGQAISGIFSRGSSPLSILATDSTAAAGALGQVGQAASSASSGIGAAGAATGGLSVAMVAVGGAILAAVAALTAFVAISVQVVSALQSIGQSGVQINGQLETLRLGITTVVASVAEIRNSEGIRLNGIDALNAALPVAADQLRKLRIDALETSATVADIAPAFQAAIGPGLAAGLNIDQIRENTIRLTQAVTALGLPLDQIKQETRAILAGEINRTTQAATALGITRSQVLEAQKAGKFAEFLDQKLQAAAAAGKLVAQSFQAASSNLKEAADTFQATVTEGLFNQLRDTLNKILPQVFDKNSANLISKNFEGLAETFTRIFDTAGKTLSDAITAAFEGLKRVSAFLDRNQEQIGGIIASIDEIVRIIVTAGVEILSILGLTGDMGERLTFVDRVLESAVRLVGFITDNFKITVSVIATVGNAIRAAIIAPLELALRAMSLLTGVVSDSLAQQIDRSREALTAIRRDAVTGAAEGAKALGKSLTEIGKSGSDAVKRIQEARKRAAAGQRAVDGVATPGFGSTGASIRPPKRTTDEDGKAAAKAARDLAKAELKTLQTLEKQQELNARAASERLKTALEDRLISLEDYTEAAIDLDRELLQTRLATIKAEEDAAVRTAKTRAEADAKRAEFRLKAEQVTLDTDLRTEELRDQLRRTTEKAEEDHQQRLADIRDIGRQSLEKAIEEEIRLGRLGAVDGTQQQIAIERERFAEREAALRRELELARENIQERQRINDELARLAAEREAFEVEASRRIQDAQRQEAAAFTDFIRSRVAALADLRKAQLDAGAAQISLDLQRGLITQREVQQKEFERRRELIRIESLEREQAIERQAQQLAREAQQARLGAAALIQIEQQKNAALKAERERAAAEQQALLEQQRAAQLTPGFGEQAAGAIAGIEAALGRQLDLWEQNRVALGTYTQDLETAAGDAWERASNVLGTFTDALGAAIDAFVESGGSIKAAGKVLAKALAAPLIEAAKTEAKFQAAKALAALAVFDIRGAVLHGLAAAGFAALAGIGTALVNGGGGGGSSSASQSQGGQQIVKDKRVIDPNGPQPGREQRPQIIVVRPEINVRGEIKNGVLQLIADDINQNGATRALIQREVRSAT